MIKDVLDLALAVAGPVAQARYRVKIPVAPDEDDALVLALLPEEAAYGALHAVGLGLVLHARVALDALAQLF